MGWDRSIGEVLAAGPASTEVPGADGDRQKGAVLVRPTALVLPGKAFLIRR